MKKRNKIARKEYGNKQAYVFLGPYLILFIIFIIVPIAIAIGLSFTNFNTIEKPSFVGFMNYVTLLTKDEIFMQYVLPNTVTYALIVGPGGYALSFLLAWALAQISPAPRTILALILYSPSITSGVAMTALWKILFSGDQTGYINAWLIQAGIITEPIRWLVDTRFLLPIIIIIGLWSSMGVGFLAILAGILNSDESLYEAAAIDGVKNRFQEMIYITIPTMKPQMLFAAVMTIVGAFQNGAIGVQLSGANPTPGYAGQLIVNHIEDYGFIRYEMGYAAAVSVVLLGIVYVFSTVSKRLFTED
ncbi:ABC transporter permease [Anaerocolumna cellulosilytica]|uniref:ABC transporter permease n=1 Tax=Anaerocolumna cellulosilytica TaxID=433286 RepID=A0A6S6R726_9FIRM|nr:sugar ABC transporter permease [Anaerocolumna cellulosilytica]MBB5197088.1 multiple sugar transport system permease protein [Anaerocolumna cellulosilytica]BCJ95300.1 ABC transporter permease [Anaerocolumna cellulosilytica]